mgnify:CR=1 FL=1
MARKNVIVSHKMLDEVVLTGNQTSDPTNVTNLDRASISVDWSGSDAVGTIEVQSRKQKKDSPNADADWRDLDFGSTINITGASGNHEIIFDALDFTDLRIKFTYTSGTAGNITAVLTAKQVGG